MTCHSNKERIEISYVLFTLIIIVFGGSFLTWWYVIDGVYVNRVLEFREDINPQALETVKKEYRRGEMVQFLTSVCKTRQASASTQWTLANDRLVFFAPTPVHEFPVDCYPQDENRVIAADILEVPQDAKLGEHYFVGVSTQTLPDGRTRKQYYKTVTFQVVP